MKKLSTKLIYLAAIYQKFKSMPPKEFAKTDELDVAIRVLDQLKMICVEWIPLLAKVEEVTREIKKEGERFLRDNPEDKGATDEVKAAWATKKAAREVELQGKYDAVIEPVNALEKTKENEMVELELDDNDYPIFVNLVKDKSKDWFMKLEQYADFVKSLNESK